MARIKKINPCFLGGRKMPWAESVITEGSELIWLSGVTGRDPTKEQEYIRRGEPNFTIEEQAKMDVMVGGVEEQTRFVWEQIKENLEKGGSSLEHIVFIRYFLRDRESWMKARKVINKFFKKHCRDLLENPRANTLLIGVELGYPDCAIEIDVVAVIPE